MYVQLEAMSLTDQWAYLPLSTRYIIETGSH